MERLEMQQCSTVWIVKKQSMPQTKMIVRIVLIRMWLMNLKAHLLVLITSSTRQTLTQINYGANVLCVLFRFVLLFLFVLFSGLNFSVAPLYYYHYTVSLVKKHNTECITLMRFCFYAHGTILRSTFGQTLFMYFPCFRMHVWQYWRLRWYLCFCLCDDECRLNQFTTNALFLSIQTNKQTNIHMCT